MRVTAISLTAAALPVIVGLATPQRIHVTRHTVRMQGLPQSLDGFTIVQLSDIHRCFVVSDRLIRSAVDAANAADPDMVVLTGDFLSVSARNARPCAIILSRLKAAEGVYAVLGNHDHWIDASAVRRQLELHGVRVLMNESSQVAPGLAVVGIDDYWAGRPDTSKAWRKVDPASVAVFLAHNPLAVRQVKNRNCLVLAGHTHGMQLRIPFMSHGWTPGLHGAKYVRGWYREGNARLYVNRGVSMTTLPLRVIHRPEVAVFTLKCPDS